MTFASVSEIIMFFTQLIRKNRAKVINNQVVILRGMNCGKL